MQQFPPEILSGDFQNWLGPDEQPHTAIDINALFDLFSFLLRLLTI
jgi:hypothetical protein